jgi:hypothetical protein
MCISLFEFDRGKPFLSPVIAGNIYGFARKINPLRKKIILIQKSAGGGHGRREPRPDLFYFVL